MPEGAGGTEPRTWTIYVCKRGHVSASTTADLCWACGETEQESVRVVEQQLSGPLPPGPPADYPERLDKALRAGDIHEVRRLRARRNLANEGANPSERPETWDPATVDAVVRDLESEDDVTVNVKLTSGPKFRAGWDAAVAHIRERFKGAARDTGGRDDG